MSLKLRNSLGLALLIVLFAALVLTIVLWSENGSQPVGPPTQVPAVGGGGGSAIEGQNNLVQVVPTISAINAGTDIEGVDGGGGVFTLNNVRPTATPQPAPTLVPTATPQPTATPDTEFYQTVSDEGINLTQRPEINFTGAGVSCADNAPSTRTDCTISGGGGGGDDLATVLGVGNTTSGNNIIASDGDGIIIGDSTFETIVFSVPEFQMAGTAFADTAFAQIMWSTGVSDSARHYFVKSGGASIGTHEVVTIGETIGTTMWIADDGLDLNNVVASISVDIDGTAGTNDVPGRMEFATTSDGANTATNRFTLDSSGVLNGNVNSGIDCGSCATFEIENSTTLALSVVGEIGIDTTDAQLVFYSGAQEWVIIPERPLSFTIFDPVSTDNIGLWYNNDRPITITQISSVIQGSTSITWDICHQANNRSGTCNEVIGTDVTTSSTTTGTQTTAFSDATIPADSWIWFLASGASGTPTQLTITIEYLNDRE